MFIGNTLHGEEKEKNNCHISVNSIFQSFYKPLIHNFLKAWTFPLRGGVKDMEVFSSILFTVRYLSIQEIMFIPIFHQDKLLHLGLE